MVLDHYIHFDMAIPAQKRRKLSSTSTSAFDHGASDDETSRGPSQESDVVKTPLPRNNPKFARAESGSTSLGDGAYNTNLFQLQVNELLSRVRPDYERRMNKVENALRKLKGIIERIPNRDAKPVRKSSHSNFQSSDSLAPNRSCRQSASKESSIKYKSPSQSHSPTKTRDIHWRTRNQQTSMS